MTNSIFQVDAFTEKVFAGNPAAVIPLKTWLGDATLLNIANENNLSETAFFIPCASDEDCFELRWFTPLTEVDLCGHATLATAHVIFNELKRTDNSVNFKTRSGILNVRKISSGKYLMDFPSDHGNLIKDKLPFEAVIRCKIEELYKGKDDYMAIVESEDLVKIINPNFKALSQLTHRGLIVSARGKEVDFVSRGFFPSVGIDEDPATGSAHTLLTPYWAMKLKKNRLYAIQLSKRRGYFDCTYKVARTALLGNAVTYMKGEISF